MDDSKTRRNVTPVYFKFITFLLHTIAAIPEEKVLNSGRKTFLLNKVWPVVFFLIWTPLVPMVALKIDQFIRQARWDDLLEIMHMFILGCNTLYYVWAVQNTAKHYKRAMDIVNEHFRTSHLFRFQNEIWMHALGAIISVSFLMCVIATMYYWENLVPLWVPFLDNDRPPPLGVFIFIWLYELLAGIYMVLTYGFISPFTVVMTTLVRAEILFLVRKLQKFRYYGGQTLDGKKMYLFEGNLGFDNVAKLDDEDAFTNTDCFNENDSKVFIRTVVRHHYKIKSTINEVSEIHKYVFFTQSFFTITHSCFLAFTMYYTDRLLKVVLKYSPILALSYYLLYMYCWNGQRLTDTCEELFRALYRCRWTGAPQSFKRSLLIIGDYCKRPVRLSGGGIFQASLHTFLQGVQQSVSYILILKELTPEREAR